MQVSKTLDYAVRSLAFMGRTPVNTLNMREISESQNIPINYLAKIMRRLVERGLVKSMVGPDGGYILRKTPDNINLKEVYEAIEGEFRIIDCMDRDKICIFHENCAQLSVWDKVRVSMLQILETTTIDDIAHNNLQ
jgi:Rrf2 family protein